MVNVMENILKERLDHLIQNFDCCKCEICKDDILCLALNSVGAKYVTSHKGELFKRTETMNQIASTDLDIIVVKAISKVQRQPNHN
jgi:competence protein ComFB